MAHIGTQASLTRPNPVTRFQSGEPSLLRDSATSTSRSASVSGLPRAAVSCMVS